MTWRFVTVTILLGLCVGLIGCGGGPSSELDGLLDEYEDLVNDAADVTTPTELQTFAVRVQKWTVKWQKALERADLSPEDASHYMQKYAEFMARLEKNQRR